MNTDARILIVDDQDSVVQLHKDLIANENYIIETATSGAEALEKAETFHPDLILLDFRMPNMDGFEICRRLRESKKLKFTKIIIISGSGEIEHRLEGYDAGADDFLEKPFDIKEFKAKIRVFLRLKYIEETSQLRRDLLSLIGHETRTPINGILGMLDLLRTNIDAKHLSDLDLIGDCASELHNLLESSMLLCQLRNGLEMTPTLDTCENLITEIKNVLRDDIDEKQLKIKTVGDELVAFFADWHYLRIAYLGLLENAIQSAPVESTITITFLTENKTFTCDIYDKGSTIPKNNHSEIFEPFFDKDIAHHHKGNRLGLATAYQIAKSHGGHIVLGETETGNKFTIKIPILRSTKAI